MINPFQYTSKSFESLLNDINNDSELVDKPNWWKRSICGIGDVIAMWNNALANNILLRTSYTRKNVQLLLELIDYQITPQKTSNGICIFFIKNTAIFPFTIQKENLIALTTGSLTVSAKRFEAREDILVTAITENYTSSEVNTINDTITVTRDYLTGEKIRFTTTDTLPDPLIINTDYYVIRINATTIQVATSLINAYTNNFIDLIDGGIGTHTINLYSLQATLYQQQSKESVILGTSDGTTEFQEFNLSDQNILKDTISIIINSDIWQRVDTLIYSNSTDKHFRLFYNNDNSAIIQFGNGVYGAIPPAFDIEANYAYGGGIDSNISVINKINIYAGSDSNIEGVTNSNIITGGADPETIENAKILGTLLLKARDRFVTSEDGKALVLAYGGIVLANVLKNYYGVLSAKVVTIAAGGGNPSSVIKTDIENYLIDKSILESIDVRVDDTIITTINITSSAKMLNGYLWANVLPFFRLAWKLFFAETGQEIKDNYDAYGIETAINLINLYFSETFNESSYTAIQKILDNFEPRQIGDEMQADDAISFIRSTVSGIDYMIISVPTFPIVNADDEITTYGTLTLTEIT